MRTMTEPASTGPPASQRTAGPRHPGEGGDRGHPLLAVIALSIGTFSFVTTELLPIGLLPLIGADLHRSLSGAGLLVTAYATIVVLVSLPLTLLTGRVPKRRLMGGLLAILAVAVLASAVAPTFELLLAARVVTALAQALFWSVVTSTAAGQFPPERRGRVGAAPATRSSPGPGMGLPLRTPVGQQAGWRGAFSPPPLP